MLKGENPTAEAPIDAEPVPTEPTEPEVEEISEEDAFLAALFTSRKQAVHEAIVAAIHPDEGDGT